MPLVCTVSAATVAVIGREGRTLRQTIRPTIHYVAPSGSRAMGAVRMMRLFSRGGLGQRTVDPAALGTHGPRYLHVVIVENAPAA